MELQTLSGCLRILKDEIERPESLFLPKDSNSARYFSKLMIDLKDVLEELNKTAKIYEIRISRSSWKRLSFKARLSLERERPRIQALRHKVPSFLRAKS